jgi:hypothetical protein
MITVASSRDLTGTSVQTGDLEEYGLHDYDDVYAVQ